MLFRMKRRDKTLCSIDACLIYFSPLKAWNDNDNDDDDDNDDENNEDCITTMMNEKSIKGSLAIYASHYDLKDSCGFISKE